MNNIVVYKLTSGQEIIGRLVPNRITESGVTVVKQVRVIEPVPTHDGRISVAMFPFMLSADDNEVLLYQHSISATVSGDDVQKSLKDMYIKQTTGIEIASSGSILGA